MKRMSLILAVVALAALVGCGGGDKVGDESLLNFEEQVQPRLGETTTTVAAPAAPTTVTTQGSQPGDTPKTTATTATNKPTGTTQPTATTATTAPKPQVATLEILIQSDNDPAPIDPQYARVFVNSIVRWVNKDSVARSVVAVSGQFRSPSIPPGGTFEYKATTAGLFDYGDGTRPYVNATLEVLEA